MNGNIREFVDKSLAISVLLARDSWEVNGDFILSVVVCVLVLSHAC